MRGLSSSIAWTLLLPLAAAAVSCSNAPSTSSPSGLGLAPTIVVPKGLADQLASFSLQAYDASLDGGASITCDPTTGKLSTDVTFLTGVIGNGDLVHNSTDVGCGAGSNRCFKNVTIPQDVPLAFLVTGYKDAGATVPAAYGCYTGVITTATVSFSIAMVAIPIPEVCKDGKIEPPETCDPPAPATDGGTTEFCSSTCQTGFDLLSSGTGPSGSITITGNAGDKRDPSFLWPGSGSFLAFFSDNSSNAAATEQVSLRYRGSEFQPSNPPTTNSAIYQDESIYVPNALGAFPPAAEAFDHKQPSAVQGSDGITHVAFAYDASGKYAIVLRSLDAGLNAGEGTPCTVSDSSGDSGNLTNPSAALTTASSTDVLYIAWQDDSGRIFGRTYTPGTNGTCGTTGAQTQLSSGGSNSHVSVAGTPNGWIATWQSASQIELRPIRSTGVPASSALQITSSLHTGTSPTVAALSDGRYAVAWSDTYEGAVTIYARRFTGMTTVDAEPEQISVTNNGGELTPFIAASTAVGGSYVVAWVDGNSTPEVRGRLLAGSTGTLVADAGTTGFLHNTIDGSTNEFLVSEIYPATNGSARTRVSPTVAVGGGTSAVPYMAFGWADNTATGTFGIIGRRFPTPTY